MKIVINLVLTVVVIVLSYFIYESIAHPMRFNEEKDKRHEVVIQKLKDIRTLQGAFKDVYDKYAGSFDTLMNFVQNDSLPLIKAIGHVPDTMTEEKAVELGIVRRDTIKISVIDTLFKNKEYKPSELDVVPFSGGQKFEIDAGNLKTGSGLTVKVFEVKAHNSVILNGMDEELIINLGINKDYNGLKVGSMTEASTSGNWE